MTDTDFSEWLTAQQPALTAFGCFVVNEIKGRVLAELPESRKHSFFKIEPSFRTKDIQSALKKQLKRRY